MRRFLCTTSILCVALILSPVALHSGAVREIDLPPMPYLGSTTHTIAISNIGDAFPALAMRVTVLNKYGSTIATFVPKGPVAGGTYQSTRDYDVNDFPIRVVVIAPKIGNLRVTQCMKADTQWTCVSWP